MSVPEEQDEPARLQPGRFVARRHRLRVMILVHDPSLSLWHYRPLVPIVTQAHLPSDPDSLDSPGGLPHAEIVPGRSCLKWSATVPSSPAESF